MFIKTVNVLTLAPLRRRGHFYHLLRFVLMIVWGDMGVEHRPVQELNLHPLEMWASAPPWSWRGHFWQFNKHDNVVNITIPILWIVELTPTGLLLDPVRLMDGLLSGLGCSPHHFVRTKCNNLSFALFLHSRRTSSCLYVDKKISGYSCVNNR